jgi:hypothetical protein
LNPITDTLVQGNTFLNNTNGITLTVNQRHFAGLKILDNEFRGQSSTALSVGGGGYGPYLHSAVITGNWIDETSGTGLQVGGFYSVGTNGPQVGSALLPVPEHALVVSNNLIENCTGRALSITDVKGGKPHVFGNTLAASQSGQGCLFVSGSIYQPGLVTRNTIAFSSSGIEIGSKVSGLVVQDNDLSRLSNLAKAFVSQGGTGHTISGNNMDMGGVTLGGIADITMTNNWWGTVAANEIAALIHDYNDNFELGKVLFEPVLAVPSPDAPVAPPANVTKQETPGGIQVTWNASIEPDLAGYKVSSGERTRFTFENTVDVGNVTTYLLPGANLDTPIAVSAYDAEADGVEDHLDGHESWFSSAQLP